MTIERLWQAGAESNGADSEVTEFTFHSGNFTADSTHAKTGTYSFRHWAASANQVARKEFVAHSEGRIGFHLYLGALPVNNIYLPMRFRSSTTQVFSIRSDESTLLLHINGSQQDSWMGLIASAWVHIGITYKIDNSAGYVSVYVDGIKRLTFTGDTDNVSGTINNICIGLSSGVVYPETNWYYDDLFMDTTAGEGDSVVPDYRFEYITDDAADGDHTDWTPSSGSDHYAMVDEIPHDSDTTYNEADAVDEKDTFAMTTFTIPTGWTVQAIIPVAMAKKSSGGILTQLALMTRYGSTDEVGSVQHPLTDYGLMWERFTTDPLSAAWTQTSLDGVQVGVVGKGDF